MKMKLIFSTYFTSCLMYYACDAKAIEKCQFAAIAKENGLSDIETWTCIAYHESRLNYDAKSGGFYGILQIGNEHWCGVGKKCGIPCNLLLNSDLSDDLQCAQQIHNSAARSSKKSGFSSWSSWRYCQKDLQRWTNGCSI